jgi:hypothetical protein
MLAINQAQRSISSSSGHASNNRGKARFLLFGALLGALVLFAASPVAFAQGSNGTIRGVVKDPAEAIIPGATVTLIDAQRGDERKATTSDSGTYVFPSVEPGAYTLRV